MLATAMLDILREWELMWGSITSAGTSTDPELLSELKKLHTAIKRAEKEWNTKVG